MKKDILNTGLDWQGLQESFTQFIVIDGNALIISCNDVDPNSSKVFKLGLSLSADCFWLDEEQRTFHYSEFKAYAGKEIALLFMPSPREAYRVKVGVSAIKLAGQECLGLLIKNDLTKPEGKSLSYQQRMAEALRQDLAVGHLELFYQPQVNITNGRILGVEALSRWNNDTFGLVSPDDFISVAEEFSFISDLDLWVLRNACHQLNKWRKKGMDISSVSVNFSPLSFSHPGLVDIIQNILHESQVSPSEIIIEITESKKIHTFDPFIDVVTNLHAMGIMIALDDFGTGYSNLKRLLKFPVSQLKLDRAFVAQLPDPLAQKLSNIVFMIGQKMGLQVVAEGVETPAQLNCLQDMGYDVIQGYLFSKPLSQKSFEEWFFKRIL